MFVKFLLKICINLVRSGKILDNINNDRNILKLLINNKHRAAGYMIYRRRVTSEYSTIKEIFLD